MTHSTIVVGIDGTAESLLAIEFAVREARKRDARIRVVHAVQDLTGVVPATVINPWDTMAEAARTVMSEATAHVRAVGGALIEVDQVIVEGRPKKVLVDAADECEAIVLGHRTVGVVERLLTGSISTAVAARAACPIFSIPSDWHPERVRHRVVVGVDGSSGSRDALRLAFDGAASRHSCLRVIYAWRPPAYYEDLFESQAVINDWRENSEVILAEVLAGWRAEYPDVEVETLVSRRHPADALTTASQDADLLVVGRHGRGGIFGLPLGSTARAALNGARCPIVLAPHIRQPRDRDDGGDDGPAPADWFVLPRF